MLKNQGVQVDLLRVRAFPFADEVIQFVDEHDVVFVVEQNESGQLRMLLLTEGSCDPKKLIKVVHYDGTPITASFIAGRIATAVDEHKVTPIRKVAS